MYGTADFRRRPKCRPFRDLKAAGATQAIQALSSSSFSSIKDVEMDLCGKSHNRREKDPFANHGIQYYSLGVHPLKQTFFILAHRQVPDVPSSGVNELGHMSDS